jgi:HD-like signal output (HDOD) protein
MPIATVSNPVTNGPTPTPNDWLDDASPTVRALLKDIAIPPRPTALVNLKRELAREEPELANLVEIVASDVAMSAALIKLVNSPWLGLRRRVGTVQEALMILGLKRCELVLTEIALRKALPAEGVLLERFWDVSSKRSQAMGLLAPRIGLETATAQTMGLFADVGIPVLVQRFAQPSYLDTLRSANDSTDAFTLVEQSRHGTDHTVIGAIVARSWGVSSDVSQAVRLHHDYDIFGDAVPPQVQELVALCLIAEHIIQRFEGQNHHGEWTKGGAHSMKLLSLSDEELDMWTDELHERFNLDD